MEIFDLSVIVKAQGIDEVVAGLRQIAAQGQLTDAQLVKLANDSANALGGSLAEKIRVGVASLSAVPPQVAGISSAMNATGAATSVAAEAVDTFGRRAALATEGVTRGFLQMANTGNLAGRSAGTVLARISDLAFGFGAAGPIVGAVAIGGLAIADYFNRISEQAKKAANDANEAFAKLLTTGTQKQLGGDIVSTSGALSTARQDSATAAENMLSSDEQDLLVQSRIRDAATATADSAKARISADQQYVPLRAASDDRAVSQASLLEQMERTRGQIVEKTGALQTAIDEKHVSAAALIRTHLSAEVATLAQLEASFRTVQSTQLPEQRTAELNRGINAPDAEMTQRLQAQRQLREEQQATRQDEANNKKQSDPLEALQKEIDLMVKGTEVRATAAQSYAVLAGVVDALTARLKVGGESIETTTRLNDLLVKAQQPVVDQTNRRIEAATELARVSSTQAQGIGQLTALQTELTAAQQRGFASDVQAATNKRQLAEVTRDLTEAQKKDDSGLVEQLKYYQTAPGAIVDVIAREIELRQIINDKTKSLQEQATALRELATLNKAAGGPEDPKQIADDQSKAATKKIQDNFKNLSQTISTTLAQGIGKGLQDAFKAPNVSAGLAALSKDILSGLGNMMVQQGEALLAYSDIMQALAAGLASVFGAGPAAALAGVALIALGSAFGAIASGTYGGGGGGGGLSQRAYVPTQTYTSLYAGGPGSLSPGQGQLPPVNVGPVIGTNDVSAQRAITDMIISALNGNYGRSRLAAALPK